MSDSRLGFFLRSLPGALNAILILTEAGFWIYVSFCGPLSMQMKPPQELLNVRKEALLPKTIDVLSFAFTAQDLRSAFKNFKTNELQGLAKAGVTLSHCILRGMAGDKVW